MATSTKTENVYQKLLKARLRFSQEDIKKTGKNMHLSFKYFELEDIVPIANRIFSELGIIPVVSFEKCSEQNIAIMKVINADVPTEHISFELPFIPLAPITSNTGKQATNEMQALGSSVTYIRRYLYMIALDICESDSVDSNLGSPTTAPTKQPAPTYTAPATPVQRQEVKQELTAPAENATTLQIRGLKTVLKKLKDTDPTKEEMIAKIAVETQGFTVISKSDCETLINKISAMLEGGNK